MSYRTTAASPWPAKREPTMQIESASRTLRGQAYDILKRQLLAGELRPGERVNEVVMAARLGISRGPLREAIRNLEQEGLLIAAPHRGTFVRQLTEEEAAELQEVRLALETAAACRLAQRWSPRAKAMLEERLDALQRPASRQLDARRADGGRPRVPRGDLRGVGQRDAAGDLALADRPDHDHGPQRRRPAA